MTKVPRIGWEAGHAAGVIEGYAAGRLAGYAQGLAAGRQGALRVLTYTDAPEVRYKPSCGRLGAKHEFRDLGRLIKSGIRAGWRLGKDDGVCP